jgi:hypothetical protein
MRSYRFYAQPNFPRGYGWPGVPDLTPDTLRQALTGAVVKEIVATPDGGYNVHVALNRQTHEQALEAIWGVLQQAGYSYVQAIVTEWVTSAVEGAMLGGLSGTAVGSRTKDAGTTVLSLIVGGIVGAALGSLRETAQVTYRAHRNYVYGGWQLVQLQPAAA